jgi:integrase
LCRTEVNRRTGHVARFFKWAVENELVPPSAHHGLKAVPGLRKGRCEVRESEPIGPVADAVVDAIRPHVSRQVWSMVEIQRRTGMRPGEVIAMTTGAIDRSGPVWTYVPDSRKTGHHGRGRTIFLGPRAQGVVTPWPRVDPDAYLFSPREATEKWHAARRAARKSPMTPSQAARTRRRRPMRAPGERYTVNSYRQAIQGACDRAFPHPTLGAVPDDELTDGQRAELAAWRKAHHWSPNPLRHSAATAIRARYGLEAARTVLGHAEADTTQVYAERDQGQARAIMAEVG